MGDDMVAMKVKTPQVRRYRSFTEHAASYIEARRRHQHRSMINLRTTMCGQQGHITGPGKSSYETKQ